MSKNANVYPISITKQKKNKIIKVKEEYENQKKEKESSEKKLGQLTSDFIKQNQIKNDIKNLDSR